MKSKTTTVGVRFPHEFLEELDKAREIVGATSNADLMRTALRHYLMELTIIEERSARVKRRWKEDDEE